MTADREGPAVRPIQEAPEGDGWLLLQEMIDGEARDDTETCAPWVIGTRCDYGWRDVEGYPIEAVGWVPLPDPQPKGTGWARATGHIEVAQVATGPFAGGWSVSFVRPDGSYDPAREPTVGLSHRAALERAATYRSQTGLPVIDARDQGAVQ